MKRICLQDYRPRVSGEYLLASARCTSKDEASRGEGEGGPLAQGGHGGRRHTEVPLLYSLDEEHAPYLAVLKRIQLVHSVLPPVCAISNLLVRSRDYPHPMCHVTC